MLQEIPFHPELKKQFLEHVGARILERFHRVVEHFQEQGTIVQMPTGAVVRMTASVLIGYMLTRFLLLPEQDWDDEAEIQLSVDFIMYGLSAREPKSP
jgi:hypothetical protein